MATFLFHPPGQVVGHFVQIRREADGVAELLHTDLDLFLRYLVEERPADDVLPHRDVLIQGYVLLDHAYELACLGRFLFGTEAAYGNVPCGGFHHRGEDLDRGGLPSAVWTEETVDLAFLHVDVYVVHGGEVTELDGDAFGIDDGIQLDHLPIVYIIAFMIVAPMLLPPLRPLATM